MNSIKGYHARVEPTVARGKGISSEQPVQETATRYRANERSSGLARYKNAYNPLSAALADAFGVDEAYS